MPRIELDKMSLSDLQQLARDVEAKITEKKAEAQQQVYEKMRGLAASIGMSLDEVIESQTRGRGRRGPVKAKFRHPDNPHLTWSGRGKRPQWVQEWLDAGRELGELEVQ